MTAFDYDLSPFIAFRDRAACERVRAIPRAQLADHPNPDFRIALVDEPRDFYTRFATDLVDRIRAARDERRDFVAILPVGPMPQYEIAARLINEERLSLEHVHTFNMDEYANEDGVTAPLSWPGSFQRAMFDGLLQPRRPRAAAARGADPLPDDATRSATTARGSRRSAAPTSATAGSAGAATSRSGSRSWAPSSTATSRRTSAPARGSSSCTR